METGFEKNGTATLEREEIFSKAVRAGRRTYFFDVKSTKANDYYLSITESKKRFSEDGKFTYEKHKLFLYKEDFEKFVNGLNDVVDYIRTNSPVIAEKATTDNNTDYAEVNFDDLGKK
jgi:hypothetical protein